MEITTILGYIFSAVTGVAGWFVGTRKRNNDFLGEMQESINKLATENKKLMAELLEVRRQNLDLQMKINELLGENKTLNDQIQQLNKNLSNVKTITKSK